MRPLPYVVLSKIHLVEDGGGGSVAKLCLTLCNPMDCSLPGSPIHGIFQARVLEWGAIVFSKFIHIEYAIQ